MIDHVLLTRFNLPSAGVENAIRRREGWLEQRVALFDRYCLPSVVAQSERNFRWLIYFAPDSPTWLKDWVEKNHGGVFHPKFRFSVSRDELRSDLVEVLGRRPGGHLLTTNLDNDDGLSRDFVARVQRAPQRAPREAIYVTRGLIRSPQGLYLRTDRHNAFCSVRESWDEPVTCWAEWHNRLAMIMPTVEVRGRPGWLQVVHGTNVSNRVRGRLISSNDYRADFVGISDLRPPSKSAVAKDLVLGVPTRSFTEAARAGARRSAVRVLGTDGFDTLKLRLSKRGSSAVPEMPDHTRNGGAS